MEASCSAIGPFLIGLKWLDPLLLADSLLLRDPGDLPYSFELSIACSALGQSQSKCQIHFLKKRRIFFIKRTLKKNATCSQKKNRISSSFKLRLIL